MDDLALPTDLLDRGWKLIIRAPDRLFAVSWSWGCTGTKTNLDDVVTEARSLTAWFEHINRKRQAAGH